MQSVARTFHALPRVLWQTLLRSQSCDNPGVGPGKHSQSILACFVQPMPGRRHKTGEHDIYSNSLRHAFTLTSLGHSNNAERNTPVMQCRRQSRPFRHDSHSCNNDIKNTRGEQQQQQQQQQQQGLLLFYNRSHKTSTSPISLHTLTELTTPAQAKSSPSRTDCLQYQY